MSLQRRRQERNIEDYARLAEALFKTGSTDCTNGRHKLIAQYEQDT